MLSTCLNVAILALYCLLPTRTSFVYAAYPEIGDGISKEQRQQLCAHFAGGLAEIPNQNNWQNLSLCTSQETMRWLEVAARNCISCQTGRNVCERPPLLLFHQYLDALHPKLWRANLLSMQSVLVRTNGRCHSVYCNAPTHKFLR